MVTTTYTVIAAENAVELEFQTHNPDCAEAWSRNGATVTAVTYA